MLATYHLPERIAHTFVKETLLKSVINKFNITVVAVTSKLCRSVSNSAAREDASSAGTEDAKCVSTRNIR